jgi:ADP-ribosylation factor-like protein 5B
MGFILSKLWNRLRGGREYKIILVGLANAGKTTILYKLQLGEVISTNPTIGSNVEEVKHGNVQMQVWDLGGQESLRASWATYFASANGVIFVVDSSETTNTLLAKMELFNILVHPDLRHAPVLILANKQDLPSALPEAEISENLNLISLKEHEWRLQLCSALTGEGLIEGLDWLTDKLANLGS